MNKKRSLFSFYKKIRIGFLALFALVILTACGGGGGASTSLSAVFSVTPEVVNILEPVTFDASGSTGSIREYLWDFGDGHTGSGINIIHTYAEPGTYTAILTVTDNNGAKDAATKKITATQFQNQQPNAFFTVTPNTGEAPLEVLFDASNSNDPDGTITGYAWIFDDGEVDNANSRRPTHTYTDPGTYQVILTVTDNDGATGTTTITVTVLEQTNQPPNAAFTAKPSTGSAPLDIFLDASASYDADGSISQYFWELGDGQTATTATVSHTFSVANTYRVRLTVTDNVGATDTMSLNISVTAPSNYTIGGTIMAPDNTAVDNDVNDPDAPPKSPNNTEETAQKLFNPVILGGYANNPSDVADFFQVDLAAGQQVTLNIADPSSDLDLFYENSASGENGSSEGTTQTESFIVPSNGSYVISVQAYWGSSNYILTIGQSTTAGIIASQAIGSLHLQSEFKPGEIIVRFKEDAQTGGAKPLGVRAASIGLQGKAGKPGRPMLLGIDNFNREKAFKILGIMQKRHPLRKNADATKQKKIDTLETIKALRKRADVLYAEPNYLRRPMRVPNDAYYDLQWHYPFINLPQAWDITTGAASVVVAVIDSGVLINHPDLQGQLTPGYDFIRSPINANDGDGIDPDPDDPGDMSNPDGSSSFHGTHVAGTVAARSNNSTGVAGIAWNSKVMPLRALGVEGGWSYDIMEALKYAAGIENASGTIPSSTADIINLSLGGPGSLQSEQDFYNELHDVHNILVIAAAGNDSSSTLFYPASYNNVVSVSAVDLGGGLADYSNYGSRIDVAAPGGGPTPDLNGDTYYDAVLSTLGNDSGSSIEYGYAFFQGTSMASPHVAGIAALMKAVHPGLTPQEFDTLLAGGTITEDIGSPGRDNQFGHGLIDAYQAVAAAEDLAGGRTSTPPTLVINPASVNFGTSETSLSLSVQNGGDGTLTVNPPTDDADWLTVTGSGLGTYTATVNRAGLTDGSYTATMTFTSSANTVEVSVIMQVQSAIITGDLGRLYILLLDPDSMESDPVLQTAANAINGTYNFSISNVPAGTYLLFAGSDPDNNSYICEDAEACGAYLTLGDPSVITIDSNRPGLNFTAQYNVNFTLGSQAVGDAKSRGFSIIRETAKSLDPQ